MAELGGIDEARKWAGLHRTRPPAETLARLQTVARSFGITRIANVTGLDRIGVPVVLVTRPNSRSVAVSQGKGANLTAAKVSGLMEAIELWHAENIVRPMLFAAYDEICKDRAVLDPARLPRLAGSRYSASLRLHWIEASDLMSGNQVLVPYEMVHADYTHPRPPGHGCFPASTNGLASGNHPLEALCHAMCEVIERDAITLWHHMPPGARGRTRIEPSTIDCEPGRAIWEAIERGGLTVALWDATSDIGVATFHCLISDEASPDGHIGLGSGTHPDRAEALVRALSEAAQTRMNYITGARDDLRFEEFLPAGRSEKTMAARALIGADGPRREFRTVPTRLAETLRDDFDWLLERLSAVGVSQVAAVELSGGGGDFAVVRVIIPGLEAPHDDDDFLPGPRAAAAAKGAR